MAKVDYQWSSSFLRVLTQQLAEEGRSVSDAFQNARTSSFNPHFENPFPISIMLEAPLRELEALVINERSAVRAEVFAKFFGILLSGKSGDEYLTAAEVEFARQQTLGILGRSTWIDHKDGVETLLNEFGVPPVKEEELSTEFKVLANMMFDELRRGVAPRLFDGAVVTGQGEALAEFLGLETRKVEGALRNLETNREGYKAFMLRILGWNEDSHPESWILFDLMQKVGMIFDEDDPGCLGPGRRR